MNPTNIPPRPSGPVVIVTGSRIWDKDDIIETALSALNPIIVIDGGTPGAETTASNWCHTNGTPNLKIPRHPKNIHPDAIKQRNKLILQAGETLAKANNTHLIVLTYPWGRSPGTRDMIDQATKQKLQLHITERHHSPKTV